MVPMHVAIFTTASVVVGLLIYQVVSWSRTSGAGGSGRRLAWKLDGNRATEIISNKALGTMQLHKDLGGTLINGDHIIVLAREFLDDDILFNTVLNNIKRGISYFYILDRMHISRFKNLIYRLYEEISDRRIVDRAITVLFVRPEITVNNFVLLGYGTERQLAFSAMIYDERPFAWLRQDSSRAEFMVSRFKTLVANVALSQAGFLGKDSLNYIHEADQIMDYQKLGKTLANQGMYDPETALFSLSSTLEEVHISEESQFKVIEMQKYLPTIRQEGK
jgi:hypothetical protein